MVEKKKEHIKRPSKKMVAVRFDVDLWPRVEKFIEGQVVPPTRTAVFQIALDEFLKKYGY